MDLTGARWHTSTRSSANGQCVEVAENLPGVVAIRDSKNRQAGALLIDDATWTSFIIGVKQGDFDL